MIKKKGRKPKSYYQNLDISNNIESNNIESNNIEYNNIESNNTKSNNIEIIHNEIKQPKKRGRKPKGGIIVEEKKIIDNNIPVPNIILHLKCKLCEINNDTINNVNEINGIDKIIYNPYIESINNYNIQEKSNLVYNYINKEINNCHTYLNSTSFCENSENLNQHSENLNQHSENLNQYSETLNQHSENLNQHSENLNQYSETLNQHSENLNQYSENNENKVNYNILLDKDRKKNIEYEKNISKKLKELSYNLKCNNIDNKSDCFWCSYSFDNESIFIPKYEINNKFVCYGNFCSPECGCAYLMNESNIDTSTKFERYYLLNNIYGKIYDYDKNIKPAPNPHYLLKKFNGNLDIQEYRKLLKNERFLLVVDKPLTKVFPELYEENDDFLINCKTVTKNNLKLKRN